jgi:hypothetical protein
MNVRATDLALANGVANTTGFETVRVLESRNKQTRYSQRCAALEFKSGCVEFSTATLVRDGCACTDLELSSVCHQSTYGRDRMSGGTTKSTHTTWSATACSNSRDRIRIQSQWSSREQCACADLARPMEGSSNTVLRDMLLGGVDGCELLSRQRLASGRNRLRLETDASETESSRSSVILALREPNQCKRVKRIKGYLSISAVTRGGHASKCCVRSKPNRLEAFSDRKLSSTHLNIAQTCLQ